MANRDAPIHIAHIVAGMGTGGMENGLVHLINTLPASDWRHTVICLQYRGELADKVAAGNATVVDLSAGRAPGRLAYYRSVTVALREHQPDIVHTRNLPACDLPLLARLAGARTVVHSEHGLEMPEISGAVRRFIWVRRAMRPFVGQYITLGMGLKDWLNTNVGVARERITPVYNGVDPDRFHPRPIAERTALRRSLMPASWPEARPLIGAVGRLSPVKNFHLLIEAFAGVVSEKGVDVGLALVGDGPERVRLEALADKLGIADRIYFAGRAETPEAWLGAMDLFVLPSHLEGISNTVLEAMATGLPVIATAVGGTPELLEDGVQGLLISPDRAASIEEALLDLLNNPDKANKLAEAARSHVVQSFTWGDMADSYIRVYRSILGS